MKHMKKLVTGLLSLVMLLMLVSTPTMAEAKSEDNDLVVALQADATNLDPHVSGNGISNLMTLTMYETLIYFDENLELQPRLAESWEMSDDGMEYTFKLREGVKFSDGEPFNAEACIANYERGKNDETLRVHSRMKAIADMEAVDEYTIKITLEKADNTFLNKFSQVTFVSPKAIEELGKEGLAKESAGTGPFILKERVDGGYTKMVRNENYWGEGPEIDSLTFQVVPEDGARIAMLKTGEADIIYPVPPTHVEQLEGADDINIKNMEGLVYRYVTLNNNYTLEDGRQPLSDVRVRQAMNWAFDSEAYCQVVFQGYATAPNSVFAGPVPYHADQEPYTKDLEKAKELMKEAGYEDGFDIDIWCDNTTIEMKGAEFVKQQLAEININVNLQAMESTTIADMTSEPAESTKVQMWYVNWMSGSYEADGSMRNILHSEYFPPKGYNTAFWVNKDFDKALDDALVEPDTDKVAELYATAQSIAWEECPWMFLGVDNSIFAEHTYVSGVVYMPGGHMDFTHAVLDH